MIYFEWDPVKAASNHRKHGVGFGLATGVFTDPYVIVDKERIGDGEQRWKALGMADGVVCLVVVHTLEMRGDEDEAIRLISARQANRREKRLYERQWEH